MIYVLITIMFNSGGEIKIGNSAAVFPSETACVAALPLYQDLMKKSAAKQRYEFYAVSCKTVAKPKGAGNAPGL